MLDRVYTKRIRLLFGRHETILTRYSLDTALGCLREDVTLETHDAPIGHPEAHLGHNAGSRPVDPRRT